LFFFITFDLNIIIVKQKSVFLLLGTILYSFNTSAQVDNSKLSQIKSQMTTAICICISQTDTNSVNTVNDAQAMLTKCVGNNIDLLISYAEAKTGLDISKITSAQMQAISKEVAVDVYANCPAMLIMTKRVKAKTHVMAN
jgi:hypothetical protein